MIPSSIKPMFPSIVVLALLASCSDANAPSGKAMPNIPAREYGEQDKIAARTLSIGNESGIEAADSPYAQALLCSNAIESTASRLRQSESLGKDILLGIEQAKAHYERRVRALASQAGRSNAGIQSDIRQTATNNPDVGANARVAMACIQKLQKAG